MPVIWASLRSLFVLTRALPGDPVEDDAQQSWRSAEAIAQMRAALALDAPLHEQYVRSGGIWQRGDLGRSCLRIVRLLPTIMEQLPNTIVLAPSARCWWRCSAG